MAGTRTFGRFPTLGEMKEYYARDDILSFLYDECQMRNVDIAFSRKRWPIEPESKNHLKEIIDQTIKRRVERVYKKNSEGTIDDVRLNKFDYISFHSRTTIASNGKIRGFDTIFEADKQGWRRAFEDIVGVASALDKFGVCYRIKYSGVRSLHFMIPFEALPKQFAGESVLAQQADIQNKIGDYFRRHCGMEKAHGGGVMRLGYSINEDNGLVSLPIASGELPDFRPWEANIHNIIVDRPWHGDIPANASRNMLKFLKEIYSDSAKVKKSAIFSPELKITPKERSRYSNAADKISVDEWIPRLNSSDESEKIEAAWKLMATPESVPVSEIKAGLKDKNADVRWYLTEALQKNLDDDAIKLAGKMLWDDDQFVRIGAIDTLALAGNKALAATLNSMTGAPASSSRAFNDAIYAIQKINPDNELEEIKTFISSASDTIANFVIDALSSNQPRWHVSSYIKQLKGLCKQYSVPEDALFRSTIKAIVPRVVENLSYGESEYWRLWILREIRKNYAIPLMILREIANSLEISQVKIPTNRMDEDEREFLNQVVQESLADTTIEQRSLILASFWTHGRKKMSDPAKEILEHLKKKYPLTEKSVKQFIDDKGSRYSATTEELIRDRSIEELIEMLDQRWNIRIPAINALGEKCQAIEDIDMVVNAMYRSRSSKARVGAVKALAIMTHHRAQEAIREAIDAGGRTVGGNPFPRWDIRRYALRFYVRTNPPDAVDVLLKAVDEWRSATAVHDAVAEFSRFLKDERIVNKLQEIVARERFPFRARQKAQRVLEKVPQNAGG